MTCQDLPCLFMLNSMCGGKMQEYNVGLSRVKAVVARRRRQRKNDQACQ